jgi:uncharacterized membrane-anchored protein YhcB (DUF1043 family)
MDTSGKIATGVLVPLGVIGLAVGGYLLLRGSKKDYLNQTPLDLKKVEKELDSIDRQLKKTKKENTEHRLDRSKALRDLEDILSNTGGKRRRKTYRRR